MTQAHGEIAFSYLSVWNLAWFPQAYFNVISFHSLILLFVASFISNCCSCAASKPMIWKPHRTEQLLSKRNQSIAEVDFWPNGDVNETSVLRGERDASNEDEYLSSYCSKPTQSRQRAKKCVRGYYVCHGHEEIFCKSTSFACLSSVPKV